MIKILWLSMATAAISYLVAESLIFEGFREWICKVTGAAMKRKRKGMLYNLVSCHYCLGHWVAAALVLIFNVRGLHAFAPFDYLLATVIIAWIAAFQCAILDVLFHMVEG